MSITTALFLLISLSILWSLHRLSRDPNVDFNLLDLVMENGRLSKVAVIVDVAFVLHSWIMMDIQNDGKMTEGYLTIYGATWVAPLLAKLVMGGLSSTNSTVTSQSTTQRLPGLRYTPGPGARAPGPAPGPVSRTRIRRRTARVTP